MSFNMIKIKVENTKTSLADSPILKDFLSLPTINLKQKYIYKIVSFMHLQEMIQRLPQGYDTCIIAILNQEEFTDLLTEQAALRKYDSSFNGEFGFDIYYRSERGSIIILGSPLVAKGYPIFLQTDKPEKLVDSKITIKTENLEYEENKDFSKVQFKITHATQFTGE